MNRKQFLLLTGYGTLASAAPAPPCCAVLDSLAVAAAREGSPLEQRMEFAQTWTKRMMDNLDQQLDLPTRNRLMQANGRSCYRGSHPNPFAGGLDALLATLNQGSTEKPAARREGNVIYLEYVSSSPGLKGSDRRCLCPLVEDGPQGLSGTFCECSVGYLAEMFGSAAGKPVQVELLESLKRGGKTCRFKIDLAAA